MNALKIARTALVVSIAVYALVITAGYVGLVGPETGMLVGLGALGAMALSSVACLLVQAFGWRRGRPR